jgi:hypothetical protein
VKTPFNLTLSSLAACLIAVLLATGCASTKVKQDRLVYDQLPRPGRIAIFDFTATPTDLPGDSVLASSAPAAPPTAEQAALARDLGNGITTQLIDSIREMGLPAERGLPGATLQVNDIVIRGYLVSVQQGNTTKRMTLGFGSGGSELTTLVEGYQVTAQGLRKLGSGTADATGNKTPGAAVGGASWLITGSPVGLIAAGGMKIYGEASGSAKVEGRAKQTAKEIAKRLKGRFVEEGWIQP